MTQHPVERILCVVDVARRCVPVFACGVATESDIDAMGGAWAAEMADNGFTKEDPDHGVWVWEGVPEAMYGGWEEQTFEGFDYSGGTWRPPTQDEIDGLLSGQNPWGSDLCDECDGSGKYFINGVEQPCICSEDQE